MQRKAGIYFCRARSGDYFCRSSYTVWNIAQVNKPAIAGGKALFGVSMLMRIASERTRTAREAVQLMGDVSISFLLNL